MASYLTPYLVQGKRPLQPVPEDVKAKASFINEAFKKPEDRPKSVSGFGEYRQDLSNDLMSVYYKPDEKKYNVAFRGTDLSSFDRAIPDIATDLRLATGNIKADPRYRDAYKTIRRIRHQANVYGNDPNINLYGFSLGGGIASQLTADVKGVKAEVFNPAIFQWNDTRENPNVFTYRFKGDLVSRGFDPSRVREFETPNYFSHHLNNFLG